MTSDFSVLMSVYNRDNPQLFKSALESVFANTLQPREVILVFDGPVTQEIESVTATYESKPEFRLVRLPKNRGLFFALNEGSEYVTTNWIVRADADDINHPNRFESLSRFMNDEYDIIGSAIQEVDGNGKIIGLRCPPSRHEDILRFARTRNPFNHMSVCFRRDMFIKCGGYPNIHLREDYGLWASMIRQGARCINLNNALVTVNAGELMYRRRGGLEYSLGEIGLQKHLVRCKLKGVVAALIHGSSRGLVFLTASSVRGLIYEKVLRRKSKEEVLKHLLVHRILHSD